MRTGTQKKTLTELFDERASWHTYGGDTKGTFKAALLQQGKRHTGEVLRLRGGCGNCKAGDRPWR